MDFERSAIKTLFYDFPIELAVKLLENNQPERQDFLRDYFSDITRWRSSAFTVSEWKMLEKILYDEWMGKPLQENYSPLCRVLPLLNYVATQLLLIDQNNKPRVQYKQLLRWREISRFIGEDALVLAYLAESDTNLLTKSPYRETFLWGDILPHDNERLNTILREGLADVHNHLNATADIFHLNWISMMNSAQNNFRTNYFGAYQESTYYPAIIEHVYTRRCKCVAAVFLREILFRIFVLKDETITINDFDILKRILEDENYAEHYATKLEGKILSHAVGAFHTKNDDFILDYAIPNSPNIANVAHNIDIIYHGERNLMYQVFVSWFGGNEKARKFGSYFYIYLLLKTNIRRDYIETNMLHGFENFATTQKNNNKAVHPTLKRLSNRIIVQSTIGNEYLKDYLETRIAPANEWRSHLLKILNAPYDTSPITDDIILRDVNERLSFVIHFIKEVDNALKDNVGRHAEYRKKIHNSFEKILTIVDQQNENKAQNILEQKPQIVGIDVAGSELLCRPEIYGHIFRYAAKFKTIGRTYHVGEDFYDLVDGIRAIDEAILFLQLDSHSRIGHALALSINAKEYYQRRHFKTLISIQAMLDNCVWLYYQAKQYDISLPGSFELYLQDTASTLYSDIGYRSEFNILHYWHSMLLRSNEQNESTDSQLWQDTAIVDDISVHSAMKDNIANDILLEYMNSKSVKIKGNEAYIGKYPEPIIKIIPLIQKEMIHKIAEKGIAIECCPSSNIMIGGFERYDKHPIFTFKPIVSKPADPIINVSINTDDKGIFATNISNEYSLITLAMMKMKDENGHRLYNDETIYDYIERVRKNGMMQRFKTN